MSAIPPCSLADAPSSELAAFYLSNYRMRINQSGEDLTELLAAMHRPEHFDAHSTVLHELHHFYWSLGNSFGYLLWVLRQAEVMAASMCIASVRQLGYGVHKPLASWIEAQGWHGEPYAGRREHLIASALAIWRELERVETTLLDSEANADGLLDGLAQALVGVCDYRARTRAQAECRRADLSLAPEENPAFPIRHRAHMLALKERTAAQLDALSGSHARLGPSSTDVLTQSRNIGWRELMEGAARAAQFLYQVFFGSRIGRSVEEFSAWMLSGNVYSTAFHTMLELAPKLASLAAGTAHYHFLALADLALNPSVDGATMVPLADNNPRGVADLLPGSRFVTACHIGAAVGPMNVARCRSFAEVADEYVRFCERVCTQAGWETPWSQSARLAGGADDFLRPTETPFLCSFETRTASPGLLPYFPLHPGSAEAVANIGTPLVAANDSSFSFWLRSNAPAVPGGLGSATAGPGGAISWLDRAVQFSDYVEQLMGATGPFDRSRSDPHRIADNFSEASGSATERLLEHTLVPLTEIVFE